MGNNNEAARIAIAAVNNQIGKTFAAGNGKVLRAERNGYDVWAVVGCSHCSNEQKLTVRKLGDLLRYPNETRNFQCVNPQCPSRNAAAAAPETDVNKMSADQYRAAVVEPEFEKRHGVPMELQKSYARLYAAWSLTSPTIEATDHPRWFSRWVFLSMSPQNRAAWEKWASDTMLLEGEKRRQAAANGGA